jgi:hypothetical protein
MTAPQSAATVPIDVFVIGFPDEGIDMIVFGVVFADDIGNFCLL